MKRWVLLIFAAAMAAIPATSYPWVKTYGGEGYDAGVFVQQTSDGDYFSVGSKETVESIPTGLHDIWLLKIDSNGDTVWTHTFERSGPEWAQAGFQTPDNGYILFGSNNVPGIVIIRADSAGNELWSRGYGMRLLASAQPTSDGGYILGQEIDYSGWCGVMKVDAQGDSLWCREYEFRDIRFVEETTDGGYILTGGARSGKYTSMWLLKIDSLGDTLWSRGYLNGAASYGNCVRQTSDTGYIIAGCGDVDHEKKLFVVRTDSLGDSLWAFAADVKSEGRCMCEVGDGEYIVAGDYDVNKGCGWLLKFDDSGDTLWTQYYGEWTDFNWLEITTDGGFILTGGVYFGEGDNDLWLVKTDANGHPDVAEQPIIEETNWDIISSVGPQILLRYTDYPHGFHVFIFDASGRKVDKVSSLSSSGTITWGKSFGPGVYFIREDSDPLGSARKVILLH